MRRTKRRKSQTVYFQEIWDSRAQNETSDISKNLHFQEFRDSCAQKKTSEISTNGLSGILGLLCAEQDVGNLKNCTFWNYGTPVRRTDRRKSQQLHFHELWGSCAQNKTSEISKMDIGDFWDSCAQNKGSEISKSGIMGLLCADQNVGNLTK